DDDFNIFMKGQISSAKGERLRKLKEKRHAETLFIMNVWRELGLGFNELVAEFKFQDVNGRVRFADFLYIRRFFKMIIEVDGFETHVTNMDRDLFGDSHTRQNSLSLQGYTIIRFTYDQVKDTPLECT